MFAATASASKTVLGEINSRGAGVKIALIDASRRNPFERRFRSFSAGPCAGDRAERNAGDVFGGAVVGRLRQWQRPQPVRAGIAQGNPRSRPDGRGDAEPDPRRRHPRLAQRAGAVDFVLAGRGFFVYSGRDRGRAADSAAGRAAAADPACRRTTAGPTVRRHRRRRQPPQPPPPRPSRPKPPAACRQAAEADTEPTERSRRRSRWPTTRPSRA